MHKKIKARRAVAHPHVKKDDNVIILSGDEAGKKGRVLSVDAEKGTAIVEGINYIKRHTKPSKSMGKGGIVQKEGSIALGKIGLLSTEEGKLTHAKHVVQNGEKVRVDAKTNEPLGRK